MRQIITLIDELNNEVYFISREGRIYREVELDECRDCNGDKGCNGCEKEED